MTAEQIEDLVSRLRERARIRRQIPTRKSVQEGQPDRIADLLEEAAAALERGVWVPVSERLPDLQRMVLLHSPQSQRGNVQYGFYGFAGQSKPGERDWFVTVSGGWEPATYTGKPVTHWMPLPEPPLAAPGGGDE